MADVFISYKREDRQAIERLAQELRGLDLDIWFDGSLNAGEAFSDEIDREARAAKAILVCWSPAARSSRWVKAEALIGFTDEKLVACYAEGPDGFDPPAPFNATHAEDLRAWLAMPSRTHAGWKSLLRRIGRLCGREDIESYGALDVQAPAAALRAWVVQHSESPLFMAVDELLLARDAADAERTRLEQEARERRKREEAERVRLEEVARERSRREEGERSARHEAERRVREEEERRLRVEREALAAQNRAVSAARAAKARKWRRPLELLPSSALVALIVVLIWSPWDNDVARAPDARDAGRPAAVNDPATSLRDGESFRDCQDFCPEMVVIPGGSFTMGTPVNEAHRSDDEGPQRRVSVARFAVSKFEVTFDQWAACVTAGGCTSNTNSADRGVGGPVINVTWNGAREYVNWLSRETGHTYRLLTEAEWEYAARAETTTPWSWGSDPNSACQFANFFDQAASSATATCSDGVGLQTAPVGRYQANAFGLYDMHGNVWEWVHDCYTRSYSDVPTDGSSYETSDCSRRVLRGGSWYDNLPNLRSAARARNNPANRLSSYGFRVARTLTSS